MFQLLADGANLHDPKATHELQCGLGYHCDLTFVSVAPPWVLLIMLPILWLPFHAAAKAWFCVQIVCAMIAICLVSNRFRFDASLSSQGITGVWAGFVIFGSFSLIHTLYFGQVGGLLLLGAALVYHSRSGQTRPWLEGLGLCLLTIKPHLWVILGLAILFDDLRHGRWRVMAWALLWFGLAIVTMQILAPGAIWAWAMHVLHIEPLEGVKPSGNWLNGSWAFALRWWPQEELSVAVRPMFWSFVPLILASLALTFWLWRGQPIRWCDHAVWVIAISVLAAPFSWPSDLTVLGLLAADQVLRQPKQTRVYLLGIICLYQGFTLYTYMTTHFFDALIFWYGPGFLLLPLAARMLRLGTNDDKRPAAKASVFDGVAR